jgi:hypothetical protein
METVPFHTLKGKIITKISVIKQTERIDQIRIEVGAKNFRLFHDEACCEEVQLVKIIGKIESIIGKKITLAEEDSFEPPWWKGEYSEFSRTHTWSSYYLEAGTSRLELWFLGQSNGCYSEVLEFQELD